MLGVQRWGFTQPQVPVPVDFAHPIGSRMLLFYCGGSSFVSGRCVGATSAQSTGSRYAGTNSQQVNRYCSPRLGKSYASSTWDAPGSVIPLSAKESGGQIFSGWTTIFFSMQSNRTLNYSGESAFDLFSYTVEGLWSGQNGFFRFGLRSVGGTWRYSRWYDTRLTGNEVIFGRTLAITFDASDLSIAPVAWIEGRPAGTGTIDSTTTGALYNSTNVNLRLTDYSPVGCHYFGVYDGKCDDALALSMYERPYDVLVPRTTSFLSRAFLRPPTYLRPSVDVSNTGWTAVPSGTVPDVLSESASERADYASAGAAGAVAEFDLSVDGGVDLDIPDPGSADIVFDYDAGLTGGAAIKVEIIDPRG